MPMELPQPGPPPLGHLDLDELDRGKRLSDAVNLHLTADRDGNVGRWVAFRLEDGGTDGTAYATRTDAIAHQSDELRCGYLKITPDGISAREAGIYVKYNRALAAHGMRMPDPATQVAVDRRVWVPRPQSPRRRSLFLPPGHPLNN